MYCTIELKYTHTDEFERKYAYVYDVEITMRDVIDYYDGMPDYVKNGSQEVKDAFYDGCELFWDDYNMDYLTKDEEFIEFMTDRYHDEAEDNWSNNVIDEEQERTR